MLPLVSAAWPHSKTHSLHEPDSEGRTNAPARQSTIRPGEKLAQIPGRHRL